MNELIDFTIYNRVTGALLRSGKAHDEESANLQVKEHEGIILKKLDFDANYVVAGRVKTYTDTEKHHRMHPPNGFSTWDTGRRRWKDVRSKQDIRKSKVFELQQEIIGLEMKQPRIMREIALSEANEAAKTVAMTRLAALDASIAVLRTRVVKLST